MIEFLQDIRDLAYASCVVLCLILMVIVVMAVSAGAVAGVLWVFS